MRVLYVALTRPQEKMILVGTVSDAKKTICEWGQALDVQSLLLPDYMVARAKTYMDWIGPALIRHPSSSAWRRYAALPNRNGECLIDDPSQWCLSLIPAAVFASDPLRDTPEGQEDKAVVLKALSRLEEGPNMPHSEWKEQLAERLGWRDPHRLATLLPAKTSVTELKGMAAGDEWVANRWPVKLAAVGNKKAGKKLGGAAEFVVPPDSKEGFTLHLRRPKFMEASQVTPTERGAVYHLLMQHVPLHAGSCAASVTETLRHLVDKQFVSSKQAEAINQQAVISFFTCDVGRQLLEATWVKRELPFSYGLTAAEAYSVNGMQQLDYGRVSIVDGSNLQGEGAEPSHERFVATSTFAARDTSNLLEKETVLVQGVIDCIFEWRGQLILLDYKTDKVWDQGGGLQALVEHYRFQLDLYAHAIEQIWKRPVHRKVLYFFDAQVACE